MKKIVLPVIALSFFVTTTQVSLGDEEVLPKKKVESKASKKKKPKKGQAQREKEAEGTEALNRFEADTVIRSKYKLNGEPLQVDPD